MRHCSRTSRECRIAQGRQERAGRGVVMHLKAVLAVVVVDTVGIAIVLHEPEREARDEDGIQVTLMGLVSPHPGMSTL